MKRPNTKIHWGALAVAKYYQKTGEAARLRDLYPTVREVFDTPDDLSASLANLLGTGTIDAKMCLSPSKNGGKTKTNAYYPTTITIEGLRDVGSPTKLTDGSAVPDYFSTDIPSERVDAAEDPTMPSGGPQHGLEYERMGRRGTRSNWSTAPESTDATELPTIDAITGLDEGDDMSPPEPHTLDDDLTPAIVEDIIHYCEDCGTLFETGNGLGGHRGGSACGQGSDPTDCTVCGETFQTVRGMKSHRTIVHPDWDADEQDTDDTPDEAHGRNESRLVSTLTAAESDSDAYGDIPVAHDPAYMTARSVELDWPTIANRLSTIATSARETDNETAANAYDRFAALAMERGMADEPPADNPLTHEFARVLLDKRPDTFDSQALKRTREGAEESI